MLGALFLMMNSDEHDPITTMMPFCTSRMMLAIDMNNVDPPHNMLIHRLHSDVLPYA